MAQMKRNTNLEEIDADALLGIDALKHQTLLQQIVLYSSVITGVLVNVLLPLFFETPRIICVFIFMALILLGVAIGCNYVDDISYGKYLYYFFFRPNKPLHYHSTEDSTEIKKIAMQLKLEEEMLHHKEQQRNPKEQKKLLIKIITFLVVLGILISAAFVVGHIKDTNNLHHRAEVIKEVTNEY